MILKFTKDYVGRETAMQEYKAGQQAEIPNAQALELIRLGVAKDMWTEIGKLYDPKPIARFAEQTETPQVAPEKELKASRKRKAKNK